MWVPIWLAISGLAGVVAGMASPYFSLPEALQPFAPWLVYGGLLVMIISLVMAVVGTIRQRRLSRSRLLTGEYKVGDDSVVIGETSGPVGDRSVVIGATDNRGNTILNRPMAVGHKAHAGPGSIAVGADAGAGSTEKTHVNEESNQPPPKGKS